MTMVCELQNPLAICGMSNSKKEEMARQKEWKFKELAAKTEAKNVMKAREEQKKKNWLLPGFEKDLSKGLDFVYTLGIGPHHFLG